MLSPSLRSRVNSAKHLLFPEAFPKQTLRSLARLGLTGLAAWLLPRQRGALPNQNGLSWPSLPSDIEKRLETLIRR